MKKRYLIIAYAILLSTTTACTKTEQVANTSVEIITEVETTEKETEPTTPEETTTTEPEIPTVKELTAEEKSDIIHKLSDPELSTEDIESELELLGVSEEESTQLKEMIQASQESIQASSVAESKFIEESKEKAKRQEQARISESRAKAKQQEQTQPQTEAPTQPQTEPSTIPYVEPPSPPTETSIPTEVTPTPESQPQNNNKYTREDGAPDYEKIVQGALAGDPEAQEALEGIVGPGASGNHNWNLLLDKLVNFKL